MFVSPASTASPSPSIISPERLRGGGGPLRIVEKGSPIQAVTPEIRRLSFSSASRSKSTTPFHNLVSIQRNEADIAKLAVAMSDLFDDDEDHSGAAPSPARSSHEQQQQQQQHSPITAEEEDIIFEISTTGSPGDELHIHDDLGASITSFDRLETTCTTTTTTNLRPTPPPPPPMTFQVEDYRAAAIHSIPRPAGSVAPETARELRPALLEPQRTPLPRSAPNTVAVDLHREILKPEYQLPLSFLSDMCAQVLGETVTQADLLSQLQKYLLLPVDSLQQSVLARHDDLVQQGLFSFEGVELLAEAVAK